MKGFDKTLLSAASMTFIISYIIHHPSIQGRIYSDIVTFWIRPIVYDLRIPYVEAGFEYPPISGLVTYVSAYLGRDLAGYYTVFSLILLASYITLVWATAQIAEDKGVGLPYLMVYLALAPSLYFYLVYNFDVIFAAFIVLSLLYFERGRRYLSAAFFSLAALTKFMNVVLLPILLMSMRGWGERLRYAAAALAPFAAVNAALYALNPHLLTETYMHHVRWGLENAWFIIFFPSEGSWDTAKLFSALIVAYGLMKVYLADVGSLYERCFMAFSALLLGIYKFTPQMVLWLLPLLALTGRFSPVFFLMELANVGIILTWFTSPEPVKLGAIPQYLAVLRAAALFYLLIETYVTARSSKKRGVEGV